MEPYRRTSGALLFCSSSFSRIGAPPAVNWLAPSADQGCAAAATLTVKEKRGTDISGVAQHRARPLLVGAANLQHENKGAGLICRAGQPLHSHPRVDGIFAELACNLISGGRGAVSCCDAGCRHCRIACVSAESRLEAFGAMPIPAD